MLLKDVRGLSRQHRTLYCYLLLSIWIFLLIAGMYRYLGGYPITTSMDGLDLLEIAVESGNDHGRSRYLMEEEVVSGNGGRPPPSIISNTMTMAIRSYRKRCTPLEEINRLDDGGILDGWKLQGVLLVLRHGDRGPMSHLRSIPHLNCGLQEDALLKRYRNFLQNSTVVGAATSNHRYWNKIGAFHGFPLLPLNEKECLLGQLTYKGIAQLLHVGEILQHVYARPLGLWTKQYPSTYNDNDATITNSHPYPQLMISDEVVLYTTRMRRTFQSALAFLYTFLPTERWLELNVRESHSLAFCFTDCVCTRAEELRKRMQRIQRRQLLRQSKVLEVMESVTGSLYELNSSPILSSQQQRETMMIKDPHEILDALNTLVCHNVGWPCFPPSRNLSETITQTTESMMMMTTNNDLINIDQDQNPDQNQNQNQNSNSNQQDEQNLNQVNNNENGNRLKLESNYIQLKDIIEQQQQHGGGNCLHPLQIVTLNSFIQWQHQQQHIFHSIYERMCLLRAYGMIRHIVSYMLRMISGDRSKFVLYMGHDWTLRYLISTLGIILMDQEQQQQREQQQQEQSSYYSIGYANRLAFEVYKSETHTDYYFRVIFNGHDVTQQITFCEGGKSLRISRDSRGNKADLCPMENIIRFLHEDYFVSLNATNFKDACSSK